MSSLPDSDGIVAISAAYGSQRKLEWLLFLSSALVPLMIRVNPKRTKAGASYSLAKFMNNLVDVRGARLIAYNADVLAASLFLHCDIRLSKCYNIQTLKPRYTLDTFEYIRGVCQRYGAHLQMGYHQALFNERSKEEHRNNAMLGRAWFGLEVARMHEDLIRQAKYIDTTSIPAEVWLIRCLRIPRLLTTSLDNAANL